MLGAMAHHTITGTVTVNTALLGMTEALLGPDCGKRPRVEDLDGTEWWRDGARPVAKRRVIDRAADWYLERVWDPSTGQVVHFDSGRLSEHRSRGRR